jgi:lipopolysaccharide biosynthesis regulator YciM
MILGLIMLFIWIATIIGWVIYNLFTKNRKLEVTVLAQANFIAGLQQLIGESDKALKNLDDKIWMDSDKELQTVFQNLKAVQEGLNQFNKR